MAGKASRHIITVVLLFLIVAGLAYWVRSRRVAPEYPQAYVVDSSSIVWNSNAQVREAVATLHYGDRVNIVRHTGDRTQVLTDTGVRGWIDETDLMEANLWQQAAALLIRAKQMPVQARGHTRTISNVRLSPGRDGTRIFQLGRNEPVAVLERTTGVIPTTATQGEATTGEAPPNLPKREDWLYILRIPHAEEPATPATAAVSTGAAAVQTPNVTIAGWVLSRFIELDPPPPIPDYFSAANSRVVAWALISSVADGDAMKPQYIVAGTQGGEGQACDFTLLRFYTWGAKRQRYETAFVEKDICGKLPLQVSAKPAEQEFRFTDPLQNGAERVYRVRQTSVRRVNQSESRPTSVRPVKQSATPPRRTKPR
jgi:hypothetical protein